MRTIYLDSEFKCHIANDGTMTAVETDAFNGMCDTMIEGYRFVPEGDVWIREDGEVFVGDMVSPLKDYSELDEAQRVYERQLLDEYTEALETVGVEL